MSTRDGLLYRVAFWASWHRVDWLANLIFRYRCPNPVGDWVKPRDCYREGVCGCDNAERFAPQQQTGDSQ